VFYLNELCSQTNIEGKTAAAAELSSELSDFKMIWDAAMFGPTLAEQASTVYFSHMVPFSFHVSELRPVSWHQKMIADP
jgi:hypothetical protein